MAEKAIKKVEANKVEAKKVEPKKVNIEVIVNYLDVELNERKQIGDTFEVSTKRANTLKEKGLVKII